MDAAVTSPQQILDAQVLHYAVYGVHNLVFQKTTTKALTLLLVTLS